MSEKNFVVDNGLTIAGGGNIEGAINISATGNIIAANISTTGTAGDIAMSGGNITGANVLNANSINTTSTGGDITMTGGNIVGANNVTANYFIGDGSQLSNVASTGNITFVGTTMEITPGAPQTEINISPNGESWAFLVLPNDATANTANTRLWNAAGNLEIGTGDFSTGGTSYTWNFDNAGNLSVPSSINFNGGSVVQTPDEDLHIVVQDVENDGWSLQLDVTDGSSTHSRIQQTRDQIEFGLGLTTGPTRYWQFSDTGVTNLPGDVWSDYSGNLSIIARGVTDSSFVELATQDNSDIKRSNVRVARDNVTVTTGSGASNWTFGVDGNLTVPGNIQSIDTNSWPFNSTITDITTGSSTVVVSLTDNVFPDPVTGQVVISGVTGTTEANATWYYLAVESNQFQLFHDAARAIPVDGTSWTAYVSGGTAVAVTFKNLSITGGNIEITANGTATNSWTFNPNGNLTLPDAGNIVGATANNDGSLQWIGNSSGDSYGYTTLQLRPDDTLTAYDQYLIIDPTSPSHIHIRAGGTQDNSQSALFLGGENSYFQVPAGSNPNVYLASNSNVWTFDTTGNLTTPAGVGDITLTGGNINGANVVSANTISGSASNVQITANTQSWLFDNTGKTIFPILPVTRGDVASTTITAPTLLMGDPSYNGVTISTPDGDANVNASSRLIINPGAGAEGTGGEGGDIYLWAGRGGSGVPGEVSGGSGGDIKIRGGLGMIDADGGYIRIEPGDSQGTGAGGYLEMYAGQTAGGTAGYIDIRGGYNSGGTGGYVQILGGQGAINGANTLIKGGDGTSGSGGDVNITGGIGGAGLQAYGNVNINAGASSWAFNNTGRLQLPNNGVVSTANATGGAGGATVSILGGASDQVTWNSNPGGNVNIQGGFGSYNDGYGAIGGAVNLFGGLSPENTSGNVNIFTGNTSQHGWTFDNNGTLTVPGNIQGAASYNQPNLIQPNSGDGAWAYGIFGNVSDVWLQASMYGNGDEHHGFRILDTDGNTVAFSVDGLGHATVSGNVTAGNFLGSGSNVDIVAGSYNWAFDNAGNLTLPGNTFAVNYANGTAVSLGGGSSYGNANVADFLDSLGSNSIVTGGNVTANAITLKNSDDFAQVLFSNDGGSTNNGQIKVDGGTNMVISSASNFYVKRAGSDRIAVTDTNSDFMATSNVTIQSNKGGTAKTWTFDTTGLLTAPGNISAGNLNAITGVANVANLYMNTGYIETPASAGINIVPGGSAGTRVWSKLVPNANVAFSLGSTTEYWANGYIGNVISTTVSATANVTGGNILTSGLLSATGNILTNAQIQSTAFSGGNISWAANNRTDFGGSIKLGGTGQILSPGGAASITTNNNGANIPTLYATTAFTVTGNANIVGTTTTGIGAITAGATNTLLSNTVAGMSANVNNYTQVTFQNLNTGTDATADFVLTADNGNDTTNYSDLGIINSGYDNGTPTNSLGNIVYAADTYLYAQGNVSNTSQSGGNLVIGTTTATKTVKIFAGGNTASALIANISNTGVSVVGNVTASNFIGNISITGNVTGTSANVTLVAGSYSYVFDNAGELTMPRVGGDEGGQINFTVPATNTTLQNKVAVDIYQNKIRFYEGSANAQGVYIDLAKAPSSVGGELLFKASGLVNAGVDVTLGNLKARIPTSGNRSLQLSTVSGTYSVYGSDVYQAGGTSGSTISNAAPLSVTTTPAYINSGLNFTQGGYTDTWTLMDTSNSIAWRITLIIGASFNNNMISIERLV